ncbi:MAG: adenosylmethionine--8-amino-7-oxononanoate transaminase [Deltaproteobacteria bacterium]|nr:adenosylmethionine--8-amino-7-oxononanoate transaminase [Deltaproteobacteria bacterium]
MSSIGHNSLIERDSAVLWHPYAAAPAPLPPYPVKSACGTRLTLHDGRRLIDGMSSWWAVIHGYNHPFLNAAIKEQLEDMAHVMFGGLTHEPAILLAEKLLAIAPPGLGRVFFSDSGSVAVEVAIKMALQYWISLGKPLKKRLLTIRHGYHGDTFATMSVCDPVNGMHHLFSDLLMPQVFARAPQIPFAGVWDESEMDELKELLAIHHQELAAIILEPIVQGAGGMRFYHPQYLSRVRALCDEYDLLLIADEVATGFGRTGELFACNHAQVTPDILCLGKALTGGYLSFAATLCKSFVCEVISQNEPGILMHGPTFMANPLACAVSLASIKLLEDSFWQESVGAIAGWLESGLAPCRELPAVREVRVLGAIGVVETREPVDVARVQARVVARGVWLRPFAHLCYTMPPFVCTAEEVGQICAALYAALV